MLIGRLSCLPLLLLLLGGVQLAQSPATAPVTVRKDIPYRSGEGLNDYERDRCKLDLHLPANTGKPFPMVVWFHGGGLIEGSKDSEIRIAAALNAQGFAVAAVNYRLSPKAKYPAYVEDAAAAVAFVHAHAAEYGADPEALFLSGHSAGGYLVAALAYDPSFLTKAGLNMSAIRGVIPISPQVFTHYAIREERGIAEPKSTPVIDAAAPAFHARKDAPPTLVIWGSNDLPTRPEEIRYFLALLKDKKHPDAQGLEVAGRDHGSIVGHLAESDDPVKLALVAFVREHVKTTAR
jgi:acetyl esterase/lipase